MRTQLTRLLIATTCAAFTLPALASENIRLHGVNNTPLEINFISNGDTRTNTIDNNPSYTVLRAIEQITSQVPIIKSEGAGTVELYVKINSDLNSVNYTDKRMNFKVEAIAQMRCNENAHSTTESIQSVTIKPTKFEIQSINENDIKEIWLNAAVGLGYKIVTSKQYEHGLSMCGLQIDTRNLKGDLHHLNQK